MRTTTSVFGEGSNNIYYNINMYNSSNVPVPAAYSETRVSPLITDPSQYYLSVMRFSIPGSEIPIFQVQTRPYPNTDVDSTIYSVTLTSQGTSSGQIFIEWNNPDPNDKPIVPLFTPQAPNQAPVDPYYYCYSYQLFLDCINTALSTAYTALPNKGTTTLPPYITYDATTKLFSLWAEQSYFQNVDPNNTSNTLIWFNDRLQALFPSFQYVFAGYNQPEGKDIAVIVKNSKNNSVTISGIDYYQMTQEFSSVFSWVDIQSISFKSTSISFNIDFSLRNSSDKPFLRDTINYYPACEYALIGLNSKIPLVTINMIVTWIDKYGNTHPVLIAPKSNPISMKLLFRKKSFYADVKIIK